MKRGASTMRTARAASMVRRAAAGIAFFGLALAGAACKQPAPAAPAPKVEKPPAVAPGAKPIRIAMIAKSSTNPVFLSARRGAETAAKDLSGKTGVPIEVVWLTPPRRTAKSRPSASPRRSTRGRARS